MAGQHGGKREGAGRKSKAEEMGLASLMLRAWPEDEREQMLAVVSSRARSGDMAAARLLMEYAYGKPMQRVEQTGAEGGPLRVVVEYVNADTDADDPVT